MRASDIFGTPRRWAVDLAVAAAVGAFFGLLGPFGSFNAGPVEARAPYWMLNLVVGFLVVSVSTRLSIYAFDRIDAPRALAVGAGAAAGSAPLVLILHALNLGALLPGRASFPANLASFGECLAVSVPLAYAYFLLAPEIRRRAGAGDRGRAPTGPSCETGGGETSGAVPSADGAAVPGAAETTSASAAEPFLRRLPARLGREILYIAMEDHYLRVHTPAGSDLVLAAMREAADALAPLGLVVHRSYWVARRAVAGTETRGRNLVLVLVDGARIPVSRSRLSTLRAAGWIGPDAPARPPVGAAGPAAPPEAR